MTFGLFEMGKKGLVYRTTLGLYTFSRTTADRPMMTTRTTRMRTRGKRIRSVATVTKRMRGTAKDLLKI